MRGLVSIVLLAGCSQILGLSNFQTASDAGGGGAGGDGGGSDAGMADAAIDAPPDAPMAYTCSELGSALALMDGSPIRRLGSNAMYPSFGSAACELFAAGSGSAALSLAGSNTFATSEVADSAPYILHGSAEMPIDAVELAMDTPVGSDIVVEVMVVSTFHLEAGASLRPSGPAPLVILASGDITIDGMLDLSAGGTGASGPAPSACYDGSGGQFTGTSGDGAAGGGFQGSGGTGGSGFGGGTNTVSPPPTPVTNELYFPYRGCQGGAGGDPGTGSPAASLPGGAVYLVSETGISVSGAINVGGQGGQFDAVALAGGGGGASGGTILLEAPTVNVSGVLAANGGGGGQGADLSGDGVSGANGSASGMRTPGGGGSGAGVGGLGAASTFLNGAPGAPGMAQGGGGGGGATGFIVVHRGTPLTVTGTVSPTATMLPM